MHNYPLFRTCFAALLLADLVSFTPFFGTFFGKNYHGGVFMAGRVSQLLTWGLWFAASVGLMVGFHPLASALILLVVLRWWYVDSQWFGLFLSGGAVGMVSYLLTTYVALTEFSLFLDPSGGLTSEVGWVLRIDFAAVMLCAGFYKVLTGYLQGEGTEYGLTNPAWGRFHTLLRRLPPRSPIWWFLDIVGVGGELAAGVLLLSAATQTWGALLCIAMFCFITTTLRLGRIGPMMICASLLFLPELMGTPPILPPAPLTGAALALHYALFAYVGALVLIKLMQYLNLFTHTRLPPPFQIILQVLSVLLAVQTWRLFMGDFTNFFIRISALGPHGEEWLLHEEFTYALRDWRMPWLKWRFSHVTESVVLAAAFMGFKYPPSSRAAADENLRRLAHTLARESDQQIRYEYVAISKTEKSFEYIPLSRFLVELRTGTVTEEPIVQPIDERLRTEFGPRPDHQGFGLHWWLARRRQATLGSSGSTQQTPGVQET
ncbi:hypothetical protein POL68_39180 [Stigmatella sp. ncwal1]|uniref:HTTM domain-containing protein n=1 Tax=Stigmatella ashevillensis TaxID=2995309 RepID=A0ABT5DLJ4_9BACT|nr:hypothetical protein [Stigmatella ashevillena]MDC0714537.1 hypothetical protein [Stigmatella ashevillena]